MDGVVKDAAPIIKWMIGKHIRFIENYCEKKQWKINICEIPNSIQDRSV
jgi:hypothetical protein